MRRAGDEPSRYFVERAEVDFVLDHSTVGLREQWYRLERLPAVIRTDFESIEEALDYASRWGGRVRRRVGVLDVTPEGSPEQLWDFEEEDMPWLQDRGATP